jgi:hypothetical protein
MGRRLAVVVAALGLLATDAVAQSTAQPPALELPVGARVRLRTRAAPGDWIKGYLARADSASVALVPEGAPPFGANELRIPRDEVTRFELATGRKSQWLRGVVIGAALGVAMGFSMDVDPGRCQFDDNYFCSRGGAVALMGATSAGIGALVGAAFRKDVWTPVGIDALGPPPARVSEAGLALRAVPGGVSLGLSVRF